MRTITATANKNTTVSTIFTLKTAPPSKKLTVQCVGPAAVRPRDSGLLGCCFCWVCCCGVSELLGLPGGEGELLALLLL